MLTQRLGVIVLVSLEQLNALALLVSTVCCLREARLVNHCLNCETVRLFHSLLHALQRSLGHRLQRWYNHKVYIFRSLHVLLPHSHRLPICSSLFQHESLR